LHETVDGSGEKKNDSTAISGKIDEAYKFRNRLWEDILSLIFFLSRSP
jgi:hypothetical protein